MLSVGGEIIAPYLEDLRYAGKQAGYQIGLVWSPTDYTRFLLNYGRMQYSHAFIPAAGGDRSYGVDAIGMRAQFDF